MGQVAPLVGVSRVKPRPRSEVGRGAVLNPTLRYVRNWRLDIFPSKQTTTIIMKINNQAAKIFVEK